MLAGDSERTRRRYSISECTPFLGSLFTRCLDSGMAECNVRAICDLYLAVSWVHLFGQAMYRILALGVKDTVFE